MANRPADLSADDEIIEEGTSSDSLLFYFPSLTFSLDSKKEKNGSLKKKRSADDSKLLAPTLDMEDLPEWEIAPSSSSAATPRSKKQKSNEDEQKRLTRSRSRDTEMEEQTPPKKAKSAEKVSVSKKGKVDQDELSDTEELSPVEEYNR